MQEVLKVVQQFSSSQGFSKQGLYAMFDNEGYNPELNMEALKTSGPFYSEEPFLFYLFIYLFIFLFCFVKAR